MNANSTSAIEPILINGQKVTIRPVNHDDSSMQAEFVRQLSAQAKHYRFLGGVQQLSEADVQNLCDVDYHNSMAFVALTTEKGKTREVGVARYIKDEASGTHEMGLTVADDFRFTTLGRTLVERLIAYAKKHQIRSLYSIELNDNTDMRKLAKELGMSVRLDPDDMHQVIYSLMVEDHHERVVQ